MNNEEKLPKGAYEQIGYVSYESTPREVTTIVKIDINQVKPVQLGEYLLVEGRNHEGRKTFSLALVKEVIVENPMLSQLDSPENIERAQNIMPLSENYKLKAILNLIGIYDKKTHSLKTQTVPPLPGSKVYRPSTDFLEKIFSKGKVEFGSLKANPDVKVKVSLNKLITRHMAVLSITGGGKSNFVAVFIRNLFRNYNPSIVIIDPHNEYFELANHPLLSSKVKIFSPVNTEIPGVHSFFIKASWFSEEEWINMLGIPSHAKNQISVLNKALNQLYKKYSENWGIEEFQNELREIMYDAESANKKEEATNSQKIINMLDRLPEKAFITKDTITPLSNGTEAIVKKGQITIIGTGLLPEKTKNALVSIILDRIFRGAVRWKRDLEGEKIESPVFVIVEEAHNFAPADTKSSKSLSILKKIGAEGRKFGVGMCVISQRPGKLHSDVLSQCNTMVTLRIVNPHDQNHIKQSSERVSDELLEFLPSLNIGEAVVFGPSLEIPALIKIDKFDTELGGEDVDIENLWRKKPEEKITFEKPVIEDL